MTALLPRSGDSMAIAKQAFRDKMRSQRTCVSPSDAILAANFVTNKFLQLPEVASAQIVALYAAIHGELQTTLLAKQLLARQIGLAYPRVLSHQRALCFGRIADLSQLSPQSFGIEEPSCQMPTVPVEHIDIVVLPGLAFDRQGRRLGWGQGHYDATLQGYKGLKVGLAYEFQVIDEVPSNIYDLPVDVLITDQRTYRVGSSSPFSGCF